MSEPKLSAKTRGVETSNNIHEMTDDELVSLRGQIDAELYNRQIRYSMAPEANSGAVQRFVVCPLDEDDHFFGQNIRDAIRILRGDKSGLAGKP